jgi:SAM-dependent methyltransferase
VLVAGFPMEGMPEFARTKFRARLETILTDADRSSRSPTSARSRDRRRREWHDDGDGHEVALRAVVHMQHDFYSEYSRSRIRTGFRGRREIFTRLLAPLATAPLDILDIGFGTGAMLQFLAGYGRVVGMDMAVDAIRFARTRCACPMLLGDITQVPIASGSVDLVTAFDIIEHVEDDGAAFAELGRVCRRGGHMLVTVPAFQFLWGNQDIVSHHRRRYTLAELGAHVRSAGFEPRRLSYFNAILFPAVAAVRVARRLRGEPRRGEVRLHDDEAGARERHPDAGLRRRGGGSRWPLPVEVSLVCLAERRADVAETDGEARGDGAGIPDSRSSCPSSTSGPSFPSCSTGSSPCSRRRARITRSSSSTTADRRVGDPPRPPTRPARPRPALQPKLRPSSRRHGGIEHAAAARRGDRRRPARSTRGDPRARRQVA